MVISATEHALICRCAALGRRFAANWPRVDGADPPPEAGLSGHISFDDDKNCRAASDR